SKLALWQAYYIKDLLEKENPEVAFEIVIIKTTGDKILDVALSKIGDKGLFTKELENALLNQEIDLAVHSMKDVPTKLADNTFISAMPIRELTHDAFVSNKYKSFAELPSGAKVGTSSLRRKAQLVSARKDLEFIDIRGNVDTRLSKLDNNEYDAIILAYAGLHRLGLDDRITEKISFETSLPATGQGAVGIQTRIEDDFTNLVVSKINHLETYFSVNIERVFLNSLEGGCQIPVACQAYREKDSILIKGLVANLDGTIVLQDESIFELSREELISFERETIIEKAKEYGLDLANKLISKGALDIVKSLR
ncbi:MAG: hydroxymethylbilane synthase, partial [Candidatus Sericytochromatia bacterium]